MRTISVIFLTALLTISIVQAQTAPSTGPSRKQVIQKGRLLRKNAPNKPDVYHVNQGTRMGKLEKGPKIQGSSRTQPMITKPLPLAQP